MVQSLVLLLVLGLVSCAMTTKEQREEARRKVARYNWLWISLIIVQLAVILYPWPPHR